MEEQDKKVADNRIYANTLKLNQIDTKIDSNKEKMRTLSNLEEGFISLSKSVEKCVELLGASMKGDKIERKLADISDSNKMYLRNVMSNIDDQKTDTKEVLKNLYNERDVVEKERREIYREQELKEHVYVDEEVKVERNTEVEQVKKQEIITEPVVNEEDETNLE